MLMDLKERKQVPKPPKVDKNHNFFESMGYALSGIKFAFIHERNIRYQILGLILVMSAAWFFALSIEKWLILILTCAIVICMEITNTIAEWIIDLVTDNQYHPIAKNVKDVAAGGVLISSTMAVIIGLLIFVPEILFFFKLT